MKALAPQHAEWKVKEPYASLLKGDMKGALAGGERAMLEIVMATHAGMTTAEFEQIDVDPERAVADLNIPRAMVKALGHARCGVYAEVTAFGRIAPGDAVAHTYGYPVLEQCSAKLNHLRRRDFTGRAGARRSA